MGRTACTEPQCLYKGALYLLYLLYDFQKKQRSFFETVSTDFFSCGGTAPLGPRPPHC